MQLFFSLWLYFFYVFLWSLPPVGKALLRMRKNKGWGHYAFFLIPFAAIGETLLGMRSISLPHFIFISIALFFVLACLIQARAGLSGNDSAYSIFLALGCLALAFSVESISAFLKIPLTRPLLLLASSVALYLYMENIEVGLSKRQTNVQWKTVLSLVLSGISLIFLSQEIYPGDKIQPVAKDFERMTELWFMACVIEILPRSAFQKKILLDTFTMPLFLQISLTAVLQTVLFYFFLGSGFVIQFFIISLFASMLYSHTRLFCFSLYFVVFTLTLIYILFPSSF